MARPGKARHGLAGVPEHELKVLEYFSRNGEVGPGYARLGRARVPEHELKRLEYFSRLGGARHGRVGLAVVRHG